jgi:hypothetical protein
LHENKKLLPLQSANATEAREEETGADAGKTESLLTYCEGKTSPG